MEHQLWTSVDSKSDKIILLKDQNIYKGNPKGDIITSYTNRINKGEIPKDLFCLPYNYVKRIEMQQNSTEIKIILNDKSTEELKISKLGRKREIFDSLKQEFSHMQHKIEKPNFLRHAKAPLISLMVILAFFLWTLFLALSINDGNEYEIVGKPGINAIILGMASMGLPKVILIFGSLFFVGFLALWKKAKSRSEIEFISI